MRTHAEIDFANALTVVVAPTCILAHLYDNCVTDQNVFSFSNKIED